MNQTDKLYFLVSVAVIYTLSFPITDTIFRAYVPNFKDYDHDRQYYIIANILKSVMLSFVATMFIFVVTTGMLNPFDISGMADNQTFMINLASMYCITDIVSLVLNYRAQKWTTRTHHFAVGLALWRIYTADFSGEGIYKGMMMYGAYSSLAAVVNTYLGARYIVSKEITSQLKRAAHYTYIISCVLNWTWQTYYLLYLGIIANDTQNYVIYAKILFMITMIFIWMKDDIDLINHLKGQ